MAGSAQKIVLEFKRGQDKSSDEGNGRFQIRYRSLPRLNKTNLDKLFGQFIEMAPQLIGVDTTTASVRTLTQQTQKEGQKLYKWLLRRLPTLEPVLADLSADDRLILKGDDSIMALPWEMLFDGKRFLVRECPLIRRADKEGSLPAGFNTAEAQLPLPLRVLGISYSSLGLNVDPDGHWELVQDSLEELTDRRLAHLRLLSEDELFDFLDFSNLPEDIQDISVLHILAHGTAPDDAGDVKINLGGKEYSGEQIADIIIERLSKSGRSPNLRLVIMASCKSDRRNKSGLVKPVTQAMLRKGVPAVVAMQYDISLDAAAYFVTGIYRELANGEPLDVAMQSGRFETNRLSGTIEWATPVLYTILDDLALFAPLIPSEREIRQDYLTALRATTPYIKEFFPIQVVAIESDSAPEGAASTTQSDSKMGSFQTNQKTDLRRRLEAETLIFNENKQIQRRTTILLGDTGGGKSAIIDKFLTDLIPESDPEELTAELREFAYHPASLIPIRLSLKRVGTDEYSYRLRSLVRQGMADVWSKQSNDAQQLPSEQDITAWARSRWTFLVILEDLQTIPNADRNRVSLYLFNLIQRNPNHYFILTGTADSFTDFAVNLEQFPQWQTVALSTQHIQDFIEREKLLVEDEGLIELVRQPWAFGTLKAMVNQGKVSFSQASLLQGRINHQLNHLSNIKALYLVGRVSQTLIETARRMKEAGRTDLPIDHFFQLMKAVRGERTYDLETLFAELARDGIISAVEQDDIEVVQFREAYIFSILYALAMTDLLPDRPDFVANYDLSTPDARLALILMAQLDDNNMQLIVLGLMKRLRDPSLKKDWPARLDILNLAINCAGAKFMHLKEPLRLSIIQELACCILFRQEVTRFKKWLTAQSFSGIPAPIEGIALNGKRLKSEELRAHVLDLLADTKTPQTFEILRWFVMDISDSKMRQKALQLLRDLGQWATYKEKALEQRAAEKKQLGIQPAAPQSEAPPRERFEKQTVSNWNAFIGQPSLEPVVELLNTWNNVRQQEIDADPADFDKLEKWFLDENPAWRNTAAIVTLADVGARRPELTVKVTKLLVNHFEKASNKAAIELTSDSLVLLSALLKDESDLQPIKEKITEMALKKPEEGDNQFSWLRQFTAVGILGNLKVDIALKSLADILTNPQQDFRVRARAAWAIGRICAEYPEHENLYEARTALNQAIMTTYSWPQHEAIKALGLCYPDQDSATLLLNIKAKAMLEIDRLSEMKKPKAKALSFEGESAVDEAHEKTLKKEVSAIQSEITKKEYLMNLIDQTVLKCDLKSKPGYSLTY